jgi:hypothetical protein
MTAAILKALSDKFYVADGTKKPSHYMDVYASFFDSLRMQPIEILELGISSGASLLIWREYFPKAKIVGLDIRLIPAILDPYRANGSVTCVQGDQSDANILAQCLSHATAGKFDVIIDDASHVGALSKGSFDFLFSHGLKERGLYFIEDYGTGYIPNFFDGGIFARKPSAPEDKIFPSHHHGMVGWLKQLIDELHGPAILDAGESTLPIASIHFWPSIALVRR